MALEKLKIKTKGRDQAKGGITVVEAHFNPNRIVLGKSVKLVKEPAKGPLAILQTLAQAFQALVPESERKERLLSSDALLLAQIIALPMMKPAASGQVIAADVLFVILLLALGI